MKWNDLKSVITSKGVGTQHTASPTEYKVWILDGKDRYVTYIDRDTINKTPEEIDFEDNFLAKSNKKTTVTNDPFSASTVEFKGRGVSGVALKGSITDIDLQMVNQSLINGGVIFFDKSVVGDTFDCQVVDKDGVYAPPNTVLKSWIYNFNAIPNIPADLTTNQAGSIPPLVYLRLKYTSVGTVDDVNVLINYKISESI